MNPEQTFELITAEALVGRARVMREQGFRLVQVSATRLPESVELTYSFDRERRLANLRLQLPAANPRVPSISSVFACVLLYENEMHDLFNIQVDGMTVDFEGNLYRTAVKFPFGSTKAPAAPATPSTPPASSAPATPSPSPSPAPAPATTAS